MSIPILMPALSPTMEEGTLAKWLVKEGQSVKAGDVIAEIETDKATMEVEAVDEGVVARLLIAEGTEGVKVNTPIAELEGDGAAVTAPPKAEPVAAAAPAAPKPAPAAPALAPQSKDDAATPSDEIPAGTAMQDQTVREALRGHPGIARVEDAPQAQGGAGATIVTLR